MSDDTTIATSDGELERLAARIAVAHEAAAGGSLERARDAGQLLLTAKDRCGHGQWLPWLEANCPGIGARQTQKYMRLAARWHELAGANANPDSHLSIEDALRRLSDAPLEASPGSDAPPASVPTESHELPEPEPEPAPGPVGRVEPARVVSRPAPGPLVAPVAGARATGAPVPARSAGRATSSAPRPMSGPALFAAAAEFARRVDGAQPLGPTERDRRIRILEETAQALRDAARRLRYHV